ncbi:MAG: sterol-binding protein [Conexibacter sp.]|nr:sterol-binding protein [Conexibacter sp.]
MAHYETDAEVYDQLGGILTNLVYNAARREQLHQADAVVQFAFRHPDATVTLDVRANKQARVDLGDTKLRADVILAMDADTGRAILHGELNPTLALARGEVRTKGPVGKVLRVVPATVGAHEVEADLPIEAPPEPQAAPPTEAAPAEPEAAAPAEAEAVAEVAAEPETAPAEPEAAAEVAAEPETAPAEPDGAA